MKIFSKKGELQEWTQQKGIKLKYIKLEVFPEDSIVDESGEGTPAKAMNLNLHELKKCDTLGKQSIISGKLRD